MTDPHLPHALRILARDIHCEDGIATQCIREAADEIARLRLTDEERAAIREAMDCVKMVGPERLFVVLRSLLERTQVRS
jgi:hypothetical protein